MRSRGIASTLALIPSTLRLRLPGIALRDRRFRCKDRRAQRCGLQRSAARAVRTAPQEHPQTPPVGSHQQTRMNRVISMSQPSALKPE